MMSEACDAVAAAAAADFHFQQRRAVCDAGLEGGQGAEGMQAVAAALAGARAELAEAEKGRWGWGCKRGAPIAPVPAAIFSPS